MIEVIFGVAEYDQPQVYEAGFIPRSLLRGASFRFFQAAGMKIY